MTTAAPQPSNSDILGFSPQFSVHARGDDQVLLLSEQRSFRLKGRLYRELVPLLDGSHSEAEIVARLEPRATPQNVMTALRNLRDRGYVRRHLERPLAQQSLWIEWERDPEEVAAALAAWPLAVRAMGDGIASGQAAAEALSALLEDAGFPIVAEREARLLLVLVDDYLTSDLEALDAQQRQKGQSWLLFKPTGRNAWLGPCLDSEQRRCWQCLRRLLLEHRPGDGLIADAAGPLRPGRGLQQATLELARAQAVLALTRMALGEPELGEHLVTFDSLQGTRERHYVRLGPSCEHCNSPAQAQAVPTLAELTREKRLASADGGWRVLTTEQARKSLMRLVSPITGLVPGLDDRSQDPDLPVVTAMQTHPKAVSLAQNRLIGRPGAAGGKGASQAQAEVSCLAEALERYCTVFTGREVRRHARLDSLGSSALDPRDLLLFSDAQYEGRAAWNETADDFNKIPEPFAPEDLIEWSPIHRLSDGAEFWIPTRYCYISYSDSLGLSERAFCTADSNGCATGAVLSEAILQGLLELVERDSCALAWYNRISRPAIALDDFDDPFLAKARAYYVGQGRSLYALDLRSDLPIPVVMAISCDGEGGQIHVGLGAHLDVAVALSRAVSEVNQVAQWYGVTKRQGVVEGDRPIYAWYRDATLDNQPYLKPAAEPARRRDDFPRLCEPGVGPALEATTAILEKVGLDVLAMDSSWPGLDFACARVVVPGLRHFWARFAPGRLYDIPVQLGWQRQATTEADLNPIPFLL